MTTQLHPIMAASSISRKELSNRAAQIVEELAEMKRSFFVDGIETPMKVRATLEAELAKIRLSSIQLKNEENKKYMQIRQLRGEILRLRLIAMGFPNLIEECNAEAESQWQTTNAATQPVEPKLQQSWDRAIKLEQDMPESLRGSHV